MSFDFGPTGYYNHYHLARRLVPVWRLHVRKMLPVVIALLLGACARNFIGDHVVDHSYSGNPQRIFVIDAIDREWSDTGPDVFKDAVEKELSRCGIEAYVWEPASLELNAAATAQARISAFRPNAILNMRLTSRASSQGIVIAGTYIVSLYIPALHREVWKASVSLVGDTLFRATDRSAVSDLAHKVVQLMARDGALSSCPK